MKKILLFISLIPMISFSQKKDVLKYFISKDSLVGVKNQKGEVIVPAQFRIYSVIEDGEVVQGNTIEFDGFKKNAEDEKNAWGYVYDRKGNFLYQSFLYDNGADYFEEGVRRFVKNGKVGFADRNGKTVIEAQHDFVAPFNYGYASFCDGCDWEKTDDEHKAIIGGIWGIMNKKGEVVQPSGKGSEKQVELHGEYYPYPFQYNEKEKAILQFFEKQNKVLSDIYYVNHYHVMSENEKKLFFEIVERPNENFPYFQINTYDYRKDNLGISNFNFMVSEDGKKVYELNYGEDKIPFTKWLKKEMKAAVEYQKGHPDNPNKLRK